MDMEPLQNPKRQICDIQMLIANTTNNCLKPIWHTPLMAHFVHVKTVPNTRPRSKVKVFYVSWYRWIVNLGLHNYMMPSCDNWCITVHLDF